MPTLRVTFCSYDSATTIGGPFAWLERIFPLLRERGIEPSCLFLLHDGEPGATLRSLEAAGFACAAAPIQDTTEDRVRWILEQLRKDPPDLFVPNLVVAAYHAIPWIRRAGIPSIGILHSDDPFYHDLRRRFATGPRAKRLDGLVCVSREIEAASRADCDPEVNIHRIPYGVSLPDLGLRSESDTLRICYLGRLAEEQKRISEVARAFCRVARELPATQASLIGDGPGRAAVDRILETEGCGLPVDACGAIPADSVQDALLNQDVLVLLSDYEGLPIAVLEAMACGVVPVALRMRSGIPELIEHGKTGLVVEDRGDSFVDAIRRLQDDPELRARLATRARSRIEESFSLDHCADQWAERFTELASTGGGHRTIQIPRRIRLAPSLPGFAHQDPRLPGWSERVKTRLGRLRFHAGGWRRRLLRRSSDAQQDLPKRRTTHSYAMKNYTSRSFEKNLLITISGWSGRLGNHIWQLAHAIHIAQKTESAVRFPRHPVFDGIEIDFTNGVKPSEEVVGRFLLSAECLPYAIPDHSTWRKILQEYILPKILFPSPMLRFATRIPYLQKWSTLPNSHPCDHYLARRGNASHRVTPETLVLNIRSGRDIFRQTPPPQADYMQPPLSFYTKIIEDHHSDDVLIVTEPDCRNPVIPALMNFRDSIRIKEHHGIHDDMMTLLSAKNLALCHSTFSWTLALMSTNVETLNTLATFPITGVSGLSIREHSFENYIKPGEWKATPEQLGLMLSHKENDITTRILQ